jgi:hypothetical protein
MEDWIDAKELHKSLNIKKKFNIWFQNEIINDQFFFEHEDYIIISDSYKISPEVVDIVTMREKLRLSFVKKSGIYILYSCGYYKIGITTNIDKRILELQTGNPFLIQLVFFKIVNDASALESELHKKYKNKNVSGEWFYLDNNDIQYIITAVKHNTPRKY